MSNIEAKLVMMIMKFECDDYITLTEWITRTRMKYEVLNHQIINVAYDDQSTLNILMAP